MARRCARFLASTPASRMRLILHIGASKCGSSAIQTALTACPCFVDQAGDRIVYASVDVRGELLWGDELAEQVGNVGFKASAAAGRLAHLDLAAVAAKLRVANARTLRRAASPALSMSAFLRGMTAWTWQRSRGPTIPIPDLRRHRLN